MVLYHSCYFYGTWRRKEVVSKSHKRGRKFSWGGNRPLWIPWSSYSTWIIPTYFRNISIFLRVIKIHHFFCWRLSINLDISFRIIWSLPRETGLCLVLISNTNYIVCLSLPEPQPKFSWLLKLIKMGKPIRNACLGTVKHYWTSIYDSEPIENIFYLHAAIFEISR